MPVATLVGISMVISGIALAVLVLWQANKYKRREKEVKKPLDE